MSCRREAPVGRLTILHTFSPNDGNQPTGGVIFDRAGNLYGTTQYGPREWMWRRRVWHRISAGAIVRRLDRKHSYEFQNGSYGENPVGGVTMDPAGNLYGTTPFGQGRTA